MFEFQILQKKCLFLKKIKKKCLEILHELDNFTSKNLNYLHTHIVQVYEDIIRIIVYSGNTESVILNQVLCVLERRIPCFFQ